MNTQMKKGVLELCALSLLKGRDRYGYELTEEISHDIDISTGTLYLVLRRLKDEDYVETYLVESPSGPARKYYHLTERGRAYQRELADEWIRFAGAVEKLLENEAAAEGESG